MNLSDVSIIIPIYKPKEEHISRLREYLKKNAKGCEIIEFEGINGLANAYNEGIKKSSRDIIITLHQDCIPLEKDSIQKLIAPFNDPNVVSTYSYILDEETNYKFRPFALDGKFTAYRKSSIQKVGLFDEKTFFTGGEDVDVYLKLKDIGKIVVVNTTLLHSHPGYLGNKTVEKRKQNGSINGSLFRIWGFKNPKWFKAILLSIRYPLTYGKYFVQAFFSGKQKYRRDDKV